jgi:hypothetical protein
LLTTVCAALFALISVLVRSEAESREFPLDTEDTVMITAVVILPLFGLLIGHVRFHALRYMVLGLILGGFTGLLLVMTITTPEDAKLPLVAATGIPAAALFLYGIYVRIRGN